MKPTLLALLVALAACGTDDPVDPCAGVTCDAHATCSEGACTCNDGYVGDGTTCSVPDPCIGVSCAEHAHCTAGACACDQGYDASGSTCVPHDPCDDVTCNTNAHCAAGTCGCNEGYDGDGVTCTALPCLVFTDYEALSETVYGCATQVAFADRDICGPQAHVCSASEWLAAVDGGALVPTYHYWVDDYLYYGGDAEACEVTSNPDIGYEDCGEATPMRVCADTNEDPLGNGCNYINCGWETPTPNYHFGGCSGNTTAGTLCCADT